MRIAPCVQATDVRLREDAPAHAPDGELFADRAVVVAGAHVQKAHVLTAHLSRELAAVVDGLRRAAGGESNASAEERVDDEVAAERAAKRKERRPVEEEVSLLGKEQREAGEIHLPLIDLGLREVGVHGEDAAQAGRRTVEHIDTGIGRVGKSALRPTR